MEILRRYLLFLVIAVAFSACTKDALNDELHNTLDPNSSEELFILDSLVASPPNGTYSYVKGYFHFNEGLLNNPSVIKNVMVYEKSTYAENAYTLAPSQRSYFIDINVSSNNSYEFSFGLRSIDGELSKKSRSYSIFVP